MESKNALLIAILGLLVIVGKGRESELHRVGGDKFGWRTNVNFSEWSSKEHFYVGDWLYFGFDKEQLNVLQVNRTGYDKCIETDFISNVTKGGRDVFNLTFAKPYYFISGRGYCFGGVKLAIDVHHAPPVVSTRNGSQTHSFSSATTSGATTFIMGFYPLLISTIFTALLAY